jgi:hypothetical protein
MKKNDEIENQARFRPDIASASGAKDRWFKSRKILNILGHYIFQCWYL